jgi:hypothetical protein
MPYGGESFGLRRADASKPRIGRPKRDRAKVKAGRKAARGR